MLFGLYFISRLLFNEASSNNCILGEALKISSLWSFFGRENFEENDDKKSLLGFDFSGFYLWRRGRISRRLLFRWNRLLMLDIFLSIPARLPSTSQKNHQSSLLFYCRNISLFFISNWTVRLPFLIC